MKPKKRILISVCPIIFLAVLLLGMSSKKQNSIIGVWKITEVQTVNSNGTVTSAYPKESQVVFMKDHYSFCWTDHNSNLRDWQMPDSMKKARFNQTIVNAGSYELKDSILSTKAAFALNPMFVGGIARFKSVLYKDTLLLTGVSLVSADNIPHPLYEGGSHIVNKLVKIN